MIKGNLLYGQSGGPTAVINSSAYGLIKEALKHEEIENIYCLHHGIDGLFNDDLFDVTNISNEKLKKLLLTPGAAFGTTRHKLKDNELPIIYEYFKKNNIRYFFYNGGNDSMDTCNRISKYMQSVNYDCKVIGIPKTIDNDLPFTDHSPGFGSCAKFISNITCEVSFDAHSAKTGKIVVIEIMGRHAGWLAASSSLASLTGYGPDLIYLPENVFDENKFIKDVTNIYQNKKQCIICVSEGIKNKDGKFIAESGHIDAFGHSQLGGVAHNLVELIQNRTPFQARSIELCLTQRSAIHLLSKVDQKEAIKCGEYAVKFALKGKTNIMVAIKRINSNPYKSKYIEISLEKVANIENKIPQIMINKEQNGVTKDFINYCLPLINGEVSLNYSNGLPSFINLKK